MRSRVSLDRPGRINLPINFLIRGPSFTDGKHFLLEVEGGGVYPERRVARLVLVRALAGAYVSSAAVFSDLTR